VWESLPLPGSACLVLLQGKIICLDIVRIDHYKRWWCYFAGTRYPAEWHECRQDFTHWCYLNALQPSPAVV
jgi:hypothetical protein